MSTNQKKKTTEKYNEGTQIAGKENQDKVVLCDNFRKREVEHGVKSFRKRPKLKPLYLFRRLFLVMYKTTQLPQEDDDQENR